MDALDLVLAGRFDDAVKAYQMELATDPNDIGSVDGLSKAYQEKGNFRAAIPLMERVHEHQKRNPDHPGQHLYLAAAFWCLDDRGHAIELAHGLCAAILDGSVSMAPDHAGGATFGLILHYMAVTAGDEANRDYALRYLKKLNAKYDKRPTMFRYPVATVKQLLGELSFEDALDGWRQEWQSINEYMTAEHRFDAALRAATKMEGLQAAYHLAGYNRSIKLQLGVALFHDGAIRRANGDEAGCRTRMQEVFALGYQTESVCWYLARHEVSAK
ncbi:hypothetical protein [Sphingorhabdus sp.]|uniref:tetratricopeptide repeat protein n=1 Tax=Sphingorhabdus sp. TaxID=1902408 RepID=UPI0032B882B3